MAQQQKAKQKGLQMGIDVLELPKTEVFDYTDADSRYVYIYIYTFQSVHYIPVWKGENGSGRYSTKVFQGFAHAMSAYDFELYLLAQRPVGSVAFKKSWWVLTEGSPRILKLKASDLTEKLKPKIKAEQLDFPVFDDLKYPGVRMFRLEGNPCSFVVADFSQIVGEIMANRQAECPKFV